MRLRLQARPGELQKSAPDLLNKLGQALQPHAPEAAQALIRASQQVLDTPPEPRHQALRDSLDTTRKLYAVQMQAMLKEIGEALDTRVAEMLVEDARVGNG